MVKLTLGRVPVFSFAVVPLAAKVAVGTTLLTVSAKVAVLLRGGVPLSVAVIVTVVGPAGPSAGV